MNLCVHLAYHEVIYFTRESLGGVISEKDYKTERNSDYILAVNKKKGDSIWSLAHKLCHLLLKN